MLAYAYFRLPLGLGSLPTAPLAANEPTTLVKHGGWNRCVAAHEKSRVDGTPVSSLLWCYRRVKE